MPKLCQSSQFKSLELMSAEEKAAFITELEKYSKEPVRVVGYNEPEHYHKHEIDTIAFLKGGFPPAVFMGFAIGHVIKYAQRSEYKGTPREDLVKMVDYAKRALDWYDETHK